MGRPRTSLAERFWAKVQKTDGCWNWTGSTDHYGYGLVHVNAKNKRFQLLKKTHRIVWELTYGPIADGLHVLHHCDNPRCVRPTHLFLGTQHDNMRDRDTKERQPRGSQLSNLTNVDVLTIRARYAAGKSSQQALADQYGVKREAIGKIVRRERWRHI